MLSPALPIRSLPARATTGPTVSTSTTLAVAVAVAPAASVAVNTNVWLPSTRGDAGVNDHVPPVTVAAPKVPPSVTAMVAPASQVPDHVGVPVETVDAGLVVMATATTVSMVTVRADDTAELFPAASCAEAVTLRAPSVSVLDVIDHVPPVATTVPFKTVSTNSDTVASASAVPVNVGVLSPVRSSVEDVPKSLPLAKSGVETVGACVS